MTDQLPFSEAAKLPLEQREDIILDWIEKIAELFRDSLDEKVRVILPESIEENEVARDVEKTIFRCVDQLQRCVNRGNDHRAARTG